MNTDPGYAGAPRIERVELAPGGVAGLLVRVEGRWGGAHPPAPAGAVLLVRGDRQQFRFPALPGPPGEGGEWRATFSVPAELRPALDRELVLEVGSLAVRLPGPAADAEPAGPGATVIDRGVLAERRARRAEAGEESQARRAAQAEALVAGLSVKVARLEAEVADLRTTPSPVTAELAVLRRELRLARQHAFAEEHVRVEEVAAARAEVESAHAAAAATQERAERLEARVEELRHAALRARRRTDRAAALAREARLATLPPRPIAPEGATPRPPAAALAAERTMARHRAAPRREAPSVAPPRAAAPPPSAVASPTAAAPPARGFADATRLDAARERLRATAPAPPEPSGPPDPSRLPRALRRLGRRDPAAGGRIVGALTPLAATSVELVLTDAGTFTAASPPFDLKLETDAATLGRLVLGSPPRRLLARRGIRRTGSAKPLRHLARRPIPWARLAEANVTLDAGLAYRWIATATPPAWTRGERFTILHARAEDPDNPWFIRADDGRPLSVTTRAPRDSPAAQIRCPDDSLPAFLAGSGNAQTRGDLQAIALLLAWANGRPA